LKGRQNGGEKEKGGEKFLVVGLYRIKKKGGGRNSDRKRKKLVGKGTIKLLNGTSSWLG